MNSKQHKFGRALIAGCLLFVALPNCVAQNWVPNPSFEETDTCSFGLGFGGLQDWFSAYLHADYLQGCLSYGTGNGLPLNSFTFQEPLDGSSCIGLFSYYQNGVEQQREWAMVELMEPLVAGQTYFASFYANAGFGGNAQYPQIWLASSNIGMLFTVHPRPWVQGDAYPPTPNLSQVRRTSILTDTVGWTLVSGSFVADSAYRYLMVGNFYTNAMTDTLHFASPESVFPWYPRGYTLIDKVCVSPVPNGCDLELGMDRSQTGTITLYPNPATDRVQVSAAIGYDGRVHDPLGRQLWSGKVNADPWVLDVAGWACGCYTLVLEDNGIRRSFKFVLTE